VLGTLRGAARKRFTRLLMQFPALRESVALWEQHINALGEQIQPVAPDPAVWEKVKQRLAFAGTAPSNVVSLPLKTSPWWKGMSLLASAAAIVLAVLLLKSPSVAPLPIEQFTVMQNAQQQALWLIQIRQQTIDALASQYVQQRQQNDYQLWMVAKDGRPPISLGLLSQRGGVSLTKHPLYDQLDIAALAVSLEPLGGSPTGLPTEVLYIAELAIL
jgi:anti-sigma-K factor RskA